MDFVFPRRSRSNFPRAGLNKPGNVRPESRAGFLIHRRHRPLPIVKRWLGLAIRTPRSLTSQTASSFNARQSCHRTICVR